MSHHDGFVLGLLMIALFTGTNLAICSHVNRIVRVLHGHREDELPAERRAKEQKP